MPAVSIVVPVRDGSKYIEQCAGFLSRQNFEDYEIIFSVDVASSDGSVEIAQKIAESHSNMKVVLQTDDERLAGARNTGLRAAEGEFIWFCDVDDAPSSDFVPEMHRLLVETGADVAVCAFLNVASDGTIKDNASGNWTSRVMNRAEAIRSISNWEFPVSVWSKMYRRQFLIDNDLFFNNSRAEDVVHIYTLLTKVDKVVIYDRPLYAYRLTSGSICRTPGWRNSRGQAEIEAYLKADELWKDEPDNEVILRHNAQLRMRSSGHMDVHAFLAYNRSEGARADHARFFKGTMEGGLYRHFPRIYYYAEQVYFKLVYKRIGSSGMKKLKK